MAVARVVGDILLNPGISSLIASCRTVLMNVTKALLRGLLEQWRGRWVLDIEMYVAVQPKHH